MYFQKISSSNLKPFSFISVYCRSLLTTSKSNVSSHTVIGDKVSPNTAPKGSVRSARTFECVFECLSLLDPVREGYTLLGDHKV